MPYSPTHSQFPHKLSIMVYDPLRAQLRFVANSGVWRWAGRMLMHKGCGGGSIKSYSVRDIWIAELKRFESELLVNLVDLIALYFPTQSQGLETPFQKLHCPAQRFKQRSGGVQPVLKFRLVTNGFHLISFCLIVSSALPSSNLLVRRIPHARRGQKLLLDRSQ
jgi:hypothetical protein